VTAASLRTATCPLNLFGADIADGDLRPWCPCAPPTADGDVFAEPTEFHKDRDAQPTPRIRPRHPLLHWAHHWPDWKPRSPSENS